MDPQAQYQGSVEVVVDGKPAPVLWNKRTGGKTDSEGSKTFPGAMQPQKAHGGQQIREDTTFEGEFVPVRDNDYLQWLKTRAGKGDLSYVDHILDADGNVFGKKGDGTGKLKSVDLGDYDASSSDPCIVVCEAELDGVPG